MKVIIDDGVIKYDRSNFTLSGPIDFVDYSQLEYWRKTLFQIKLIGEYPVEKIGYGNISEVKDYSHLYKSTVPQFIITGTQTGNLSNLDGHMYTRVLDYEIDLLKIKVIGPIEASSEALTHAAIYEINSKIKSIFHIHSNKIWNGMIKDHFDFTASNIPYGTVEMARATQRCIGNKDAGVFCMKGHNEGVIAYGKNLIETGEILLDLYKKYMT